MSRYTLTLALAAALSLPVGADFNSAVTAYENKQFEAAYNEFRRLAELGDAPSQRNLAAMYARGEFVGKNLVESWAWAALAAEEDNEEATKLRDQVARKISAEQLIEAQVRLGELTEQFGHVAVAARLLPIPTENRATCTVSGDSPAIPVSTQAPNYPAAAQRAGISGFACLRFYLDRNGKPRRISAYESAVYGVKAGTAAERRYAHQFEQQSLAAVTDWIFLSPANEKLREMPAKYCLDFKLNSSQDNSIEAYNPDKVRAKLDTLNPLVEAGDGRAQYDLAELLTTELHPGRARRQELTKISDDLYINSAINGDARGQYKLASKLLTGDRCVKDLSKGIFWLTVSAQQGNAQAAWLLAQRLDEGEDVKQQKSKSLRWLKVAADGGHARAKLQYALTLLDQDPTRITEATSYLPQFSESDDIALLEAHARVVALSGDFATAIAQQEKVVSLAREMDFEVETREQALAAYRNNTLPTVSPH